MKKILRTVIATAAVALLSTVTISAQEMMKKTEKEKPVVAVVRADWCAYCKRVEPVMMKLMEEYKEKLNFVVLDVTNEETSKAAMEKAEATGLTDFFNQNKEKTSTVAVIKDKKIIYKTSNNAKRNDYVKAFEKALE